MAPNQVRILAGQWRGRKINFSPLKNLRPTGCRIRETLFNWLQPHIANSTCLDLFAGSGILSFEALSRGANKVLTLDASAQIIQTIQQQAMQLKTSQLQATQQDAYQFIQQTSTQTYDIIFIDPPFLDQRLTEICAALANNHWLKPKGLIYVEKDKQQIFTAPVAWQLLKDKTAGAVSYQLYISIPLQDANS